MRFNLEKLKRDIEERKIEHQRRKNVYQKLNEFLNLDGSYIRIEKGHYTMNRIKGYFKTIRYGKISINHETHPHRTLRDSDGFPPTLK